VVGKGFSRVFHYAQFILFFCISPFLRFFGRVVFWGEKGGRKDPIFIVGAPRTGSTIFYQALTNYYNVLYFDNVVSRWYRTILFGFWLSSRKYGMQPHHSFSSEHGVTKGGHSPSECGEFWYRWLPKDRHFVEKADPVMAASIAKEINQVSARFGLPLVFKNLNAGQRLRLIIKAFPDARIVFIRRDPRFVLRSILKARQKVGVTEGQWWSVRPPHFDRYLGLSEIQMCAAQVFYVERQIIEDLKLFPSANVHVVNYNDLSSGLLMAIGAELSLTKRPGGSLPIFTQDSEESVPAHEMDALSQAIACYPFSELHYEK
jgi:hypothetical protein